MKMKTLLLGLASGVLLAACGGPVPEEMDAQEQLGTTEGAVCEGWDSGGRLCTWRCIRWQAQSASGLWDRDFSGVGAAPDLARSMPRRRGGPARPPAPARDLPGSARPSQPIPAAPAAPRCSP